jgi:hypothetical protein
MICDYELEGLIRRGCNIFLLDEPRCSKANEAIWRNLAHCRRVIIHLEERDAARTAATRSFLEGVDLSFLKPPPDYLAGMHFSRGLLGPPEE